MANTLIRGPQLVPLTEAEGGGGKWFDPTKPPYDPAHPELPTQWSDVRTSAATEYREAFKIENPDEVFWVESLMPGDPSGKVWYSFKTGAELGLNRNPHVTIVNIPYLWTIYRTVEGPPIPTPGTP